MDDNYKYYDSIHYDNKLSHALKIFGHQTDVITFSFFNDTLYQVILSYMSDPKLIDCYMSLSTAIDTTYNQVGVMYGESDAEVNDVDVALKLNQANLMTFWEFDFIGVIYGLRTTFIPYQDKLGGFVSIDLICQNSKLVKEAQKPSHKKK